MMLHNDPICSVIEPDSLNEVFQFRALVHWVLSAVSFDELSQSSTQSDDLSFCFLSDFHKLYESSVLI